MEPWSYIRDLKQAVRRLIDDELGRHQNRDGSVAVTIAENHNPADCAQCAVEDLLR